MKILNRNPRTVHSAKCLSTRDLVNSFSPKASKRSKDKVIDHICECQGCRDAFTMLMEIVEQDAQNPRRETAAGRESGPKGLLVRYATLTIGLLLIFSSVLFLVRQEDISRGHPEGRAAFLLSYPLSSHSISKPLVFRWEACPLANRYVLELFDESLLPIWTSGAMEGHQIVVLHGSEIGLEAEKSFFWTITAYSDDDKIAESALGRFTVTR